MSNGRRLKRLERRAAEHDGDRCPGCVRPITFHNEYRLPNGETVTLPPLPDIPAGTCNRPRRLERPIRFIVFAMGEVTSREEAERLYADHAAFHRRGGPVRPPRDPDCELSTLQIRH